MQSPVASAGGVPVAADDMVDVVEAACVSLLEDDVVAAVDDVVFAADLVGVPLVDAPLALVEASAAAYHSLTP